jgi:adenosine deaminase
LRDNPTALLQFLREMPKGADLHVHLSGAVYAEDFIGWAAAAKLCVQRDFKLVTPDSQQQCDPGKTRPVADALTDQSFYDGIVNAFSMRSYVPTVSRPSGHDQFFVTFGRYGEVSWRVTGEMTAMLLRRYAAEHVQHTELMVTLTPQSPELSDTLVSEIRAANEPAAKLAVLKDYIEQAVPNAKANIDGWQAATRKELGCDTATPDPGCKVTYRFIGQVNRNSDPAKVFANTALAAAITRADPRVAGLNFVGPEDYRVARTDYRQHMQMIGFLAKDVPVALHAGELWAGLVPPDDLTFHIQDAVATAGAKRIGHGVALAYERKNAQLLADMRKRKVAVEINLTSNDVILGVRGKDHPLTTYRAAGVPVALSTDDAGVSRIDLSNEYFRAARDYPLGYRDLKAIARASIEHAFLGTDAKRDALAEFDRSSVTFERTVAAEKGFVHNMGAVIASWFR